MQPTVLPALVARTRRRRSHQLGAPTGVLAQAFDESQSVDKVLFRLRIEGCRSVANATPAPRRAAGVIDPATYKPQTEFDNTPWRFDMSQNGKRMTAEEFDAWMKARGVRVAKGGAALPPARRAGDPRRAGCARQRRHAGTAPTAPRRARTPRRRHAAPRHRRAADVARTRLTSPHAPQPAWPHGTAPRTGARAVQARRVFAHAKPREWIRAGRVSVDGRIVRDPEFPTIAGRHRIARRRPRAR